MGEWSGRDRTEYIPCQPQAQYLDPLQAWLVCSCIARSYSATSVIRLCTVSKYYHKCLEAVYPCPNAAGSVMWMCTVSKYYQKCHPPVSKCDQKCYLAVYRLQMLPEVSLRCVPCPNATSSLIWLCTVSKCYQKCHQAVCRVQMLPVVSSTCVLCPNATTSVITLCAVSICYH